MEYGGKKATSIGMEMGQGQWLPTTQEKKQIREKKKGYQHEKNMTEILLPEKIIATLEGGGGGGKKKKGGGKKSTTRKSLQGSQKKEKHSGKKTLDVSWKCLIRNGGGGQGDITSQEQLHVH